METYMKMKKNQKNKHKYYVKVKSKIHSEIFHLILINLYCYEKMPKEKELVKQYLYTKQIK